MQSQKLQRKSIHWGYIANGERSPDLGNTVRVQSRPTNCVLKSAKETMAEKFNGVFQISD